MTAARRTLHVDGSQGASGDMVLGAPVDLGASVDDIRTAPAGLPLQGWTLTAHEPGRCSFRARKVDAELSTPEPRLGATPPHHGRA